MASARPRLLPLRLSSQDPAYNTDWVFSSDSPVHIANNLGWFMGILGVAEFATIDSTNVAATVKIGGKSMKVVGFGGVQLVAPNLDRSAIQSIGTRYAGQPYFCCWQHPDQLDQATGGRLRFSSGSGSVLFSRYGPNPTRRRALRSSAPFNIVGKPLLDKYTVDQAQIRLKAKGSVDALLDTTTPLPKLWLKGQVQGQTSLRANQSYDASVQWSIRQQAEIKAAKIGMGLTPAAPFSELPGFTAEERAWLKKQGGQSSFFEKYCLRRDRKPDRAKALMMVRVYMEAEREELALSAQAVTVMAQLGALFSGTHLALD
ncbi:hypothetical protein BAUCODRAFT_570807 [Baudoinia panamericana UAMH 10762]|uniref:Uncharacterized protein n=1 Tax=Baudoinia panamericana (strain UAMH 10762) TaxID=717646 RepID=M2M3H2_BAUPA|nr:uncharacterized protein BAUCODRAFT_570807 [Baudoinia panamericana UAMH 10762]EMC91081.1 hypothetical protein BAUCODRAFT_570807 [Baudoinia panamericana UAMH 10762]